MNLRNKKLLAAKTLGVGKKRIIFTNEGLPEIKEAITKQDIHTLHQEGIILIKPVKGRRKVEHRKRRGPGKIKKTINYRKQNYVKITRKLRKYLKELISRGEIDKKLYYELRKKIKMSSFRSKAHMKESIEKPVQKIEDKELKEIKPKKIKKIKSEDKNETRQEKKTRK